MAGRMPPGEGLLRGMEDARPGRRLKPLSGRLGPEMTAWVTRLREFYTGLDMTYVELVEVLGGDPSTLSRYFNGQRLPEIGFLERLYKAVETKTRAPVQDTVKESVRTLYFAACRVREPRLHEVYVLREQLEQANRRAEDAQERVWELELLLEAERIKRDNAEAALRQLEAERSDGAVDAVRQQLARTLAERERLDALVAQHTAELAQAVRARYLVSQQHHDLAQALARAEQTLEADLEQRWAPTAEEAEAEQPRRWSWWRWGARRRELKELHRASQQMVSDLPRLLEEVVQSGSVANIDIGGDSGLLGGVRPQGLVGDVAAALQEVQREAVRLAAEQALLRRHVNAMLTNLSHRSEVLIHRQLNLLDELESREHDPEQLASLFRLDHLATRMRRNGENLLVLAGAEPRRRIGGPVPLRDVLRGAVAEVEDYERVELAVVPDVDVIDRAVNDLMHLLAELLENATMFSPPHTTVQVTGDALPDGRVLIEIHDSGLGLATEDLLHVNERLASPPTSDVSDTDRLGLLIAARLSDRHGIRIQLRSSESGGTTALVVLPAGTVGTADARATSTRGWG